MNILEKFGFSKNKYTSENLEKAKQELASLAEKHRQAYIPDAEGKVNNTELSFLESKIEKKRKEIDMLEAEKILQEKNS